MYKVVDQNYFFYLKMNSNITVAYKKWQTSTTPNYREDRNICSDHSAVWKSTNPLNFCFDLCSKQEIQNADSYQCIRWISE